MMPATGLTMFSFDALTWLPLVKMASCGFSTVASGDIKECLDPENIDDFFSRPVVLLHF